MSVEAPYGIAAVLVCLLSWFSKDHAMQKMSIVLLFSWGVSNFLFGTMTPPHLLAANAISDMVGAGISFVILKPTKNLRYGILFAYVVMVTCHVIWLTIRPAPYGYYYGTLNVLFALQLLFVGVASLKLIGIALYGWFINFGHRNIPDSHGVRSSLSSRRVK